MLGVDSADHLPHLQVDQRMVGITIRMILGNDLLRLIVAVLSDQPKDHRVSSFGQRKGKILV